MCHILLIKEQSGFCNLFIFYFHPFLYNTFTSFFFFTQIGISPLALFWGFLLVWFLTNVKMHDKGGFCEHGNNIVWIWMAISLPRKRSVGEIYVFVTNKFCVNMQLSKKLSSSPTKQTWANICVYKLRVGGFSAAIASYVKNVAHLKLSRHSEGLWAGSKQLNDVFSLNLTFSRRWLSRALFCWMWRHVVR